MFGTDINQSNISAGGDVAGHDITHIHNNAIPPTWYQQKFMHLAAEIEKDQRYESTIDDLVYYQTLLDGQKGLEEKLKDGGLNNAVISSAIRKKLKFAKKLEKYKYYVSAQWINSHLFAEIIMKFNDYIVPMIEAGEDKQSIMSSVSRYVINPLVQKLNKEGSNDNYLCYDAEDIYGMVFFLTGRCHINWKSYDNVQPSI